MTRAFHIAHPTSQSYIAVPVNAPFAEVPNQCKSLEMNRKTPSLQPQFMQTEVSALPSPKHQTH